MVSSAMPKEDLTALETRIAHLERLAEDLSDVVARQETELVALTRRVQILVQREAERELTEAGGAMLGDERPPHW